MSIPDVAEFEEIFIGRLAITRAREMLRRNMNTLLAYHASGGHEERIVHLIGYRYAPFTSLLPQPMLSLSLQGHEHDQ